MTATAHVVQKISQETDMSPVVARVKVAEFVGDSNVAVMVEDLPEPAELVAGEIDWHDLVARIHRGEDSGMEELYKLFAKGNRIYICRQLGPQELDDKIHDTFLIVVKAIRKGDLREPERLMGFVRTVVRRQVAAHIDKVSVLDGLSVRDREILSRFYLDEQTQEEICDEMDLSETQFRLLKSRAKARFGELGKRKLIQRPMSAISVRTSAAFAH
jgi:RNA polymerase sigma-70 factor (ECF subfamily)